MRRRTVIASALALITVASLASCGTSAAEPGTNVEVTLTDKEILLSAPTVSASTVTFTFTNKGTVMHSVVILRTDLGHDRIPADPKDPSKVQEPGSIAVTGEIAVGASKQLSRKLTAGQYVLVCNEPAHYIVGMHTALVVR
jgi:uncharacterized cupredoxin-like copper-binding protein